MRASSTTVEPRRWLTAAIVGFAVCAVLIVFGFATGPRFLHDVGIVGLCVPILFAMRWRRDLAEERDSGSGA